MKRGEIKDPRQLGLYAKAQAAISEIKAEPVAAAPPAERREEKPREEAAARREVEFRYPVDISPAGEAAWKVERTRDANGRYVESVIGRLYVSQKQDERGGLLELQADNAVIFRERGEEP
ncbi:MAG: hypothetical protein ACYTEQ_26115, partial [Planctomycetota bacterium]